MAEKTEGPPYKSAADVPKGRPTPTQDELNRIKKGEHVELAADGSAADTANQPLAPGGKDESHSGTPTHRAHEGASTRK